MRASADGTKISLWLQPAGALLVSVVCCVAALAEARAADAPAAAGDAAPVGVNLANMDTSVRPGDNFFGFVNGTWLKNTEIPADRSRWGVFNELTEINRQRNADLIKELAAKPGAPGSESRKIADYYASFMDEAAIEKLGFAPVRPALARIKAISDRAELSQWLGSTLRADVDVLNATQIETDNILGLWIAQDLDDPARYSPFLLQGGLSMPDRDYYLDKSPSMDEARRAFQAHIEAVLKLAGIPDPHGAAARVYALEMRIAAVHATRTERWMSPRATITGVARISMSARPAWTGANSSRLRAWVPSRSSWSGIRGQLPALPRWSARLRSMTGAATSVSMRSST